MAALAAARPAGAQPACEQWREGSTLPGVSGQVFAMTTWDPDGTGPRPPLVVVGGQFTAAGDVPANYIAAWDGTSWQSLGTGGANGVNGTIVALTVYNGRLIAGGSFTQAGGQTANYVAAWDGTSWHPLGAGVLNGMDGFVKAFTVYNGRLIAGGEFTQAGGQTANRLAAWDGASWQPLGTGAANGMNGNVSALAVYNSRLVAGGNFMQAGGQSANGIAAWDGTSWQSLGTGGANGVNGTIEALTVYNGRLIAGGSFTQAGGQAANRVAAWDGTSWQPLGTGGSNGVGSEPVRALAEYNGRLIAGGDFTQAGGQTANGVAAWDGTSWQPLGTSAASGVSIPVRALTVQSGRLFAGGFFTQVGGQVAAHVVMWDATTWLPLGSVAASGLNNWVWALTVYNGRLVAGGRFTQAGGQIASRIAAWDGAAWQSLGTGAANGVNSDVEALAVYNNRLIAAGFFTQAGGQVANRVAAWDGTSWQSLGIGAANGVNTPVKALTVYNGRLVAGGFFSQAGGQAANYIAAWDGTLWQPLGAGAANGLGDSTTALTVYNGRLVAGGNFTQAGGQSANGIAAWDGTSWQSLGTGGANGVNSTINALTVYNGRLIVAGFFTQAGGQTANRVAAWDGTSWQALGTGAANGVNDTIYSLTVYNGRLIAGGIFTQAGGQAANRVAAWDGTSWQPLGTGADSFVHSLSPFDPDGVGPRLPGLVAAGRFGTAGGRVSPFFAAWGPPTDSAWSAPAGGSTVPAANWQCSATPDALQSIFFDRVAAGVNLNPAYQVNVLASLVAKRMTASTDNVTINLAGQSLNLVQPPSAFRPGLVVGDRSGFSNTLSLINSATAATVQAGGLNVGRVAGAVSTLNVSNAATTLRVAGSTIIGDAGDGTLNVNLGGRVQYGQVGAAGASDIFAVGLSPCPLTGTSSCDGVNVFSGGQLISSSSIGTVSIGGAIGSRGAVTLTGSTALWSAQQQNFYLGDLGRGALSISGGAKLLTQTSNQAVVARLPGSSAAVSIRGPGSEWTESLAAISVGAGGAATINVADGGVLRAPSFLNLASATLTGNGTIAATNTVNVGTISPGDAETGSTFGTLVVDGNFSQLGLDPGSNRPQSGRLSLDLGSGQADRLQVTGQATLGGGLFVSLAPGFDPPAGYAPALLEPGLRSGQFDVAYFPGLSNNRFFLVDYGQDSGTVSLGIGTLSTQIGFGAAATFTGGGTPTSAALADLNGDNLPDLALSVPATTPGSNGAVVVLLNGGTTGGAWNNWAQQITLPVGRNPNGIAIGRLTSATGRNDIIVANTDDDSVTVLRNGGGAVPAFTPSTLAGVGPRPISIALGRFGAPTSSPLSAVVALSGEALASQSVSYYTNAGGTLSFNRRVPGGVRPSRIRRDERNKDGDRIVTLNPGSSGTAGSVSIVQQSGSNFSLLGTLSVGIDPTDLALVDLSFPADGAPEIVVSNGGEGTLSVLANLGNPALGTGGFAPQVAIPAGAPGPVSVTVGDLDGDSKPDLAVAAQGPAVQIVRNTSTGGSLTFTPASPLPQSQPAVLVADADVDGDGRVEVVAIGAGGTDLPQFVTDVRPNRGGAVCYPNCDSSTAPPVLNALDFSCFLGRFTAAQSLPAAQQLTDYANCDSSTASPVLNVLDFSCFLQRFRQGCQ